MFTTKGIDVINKLIRNLASNFISGGFATDYYISTIESEDYNSTWMPKSTDKPDFVLQGFNNQTEQESIRGLNIIVPIDNEKSVHAALLEGSYLTENTQFRYDAGLI